MRAILSDILGNLEALTVVREEIRRKGIGEVYNLGDNLGPGPNPVECLDLAMDMAMVLLGDHEERVLCDSLSANERQEKTRRFNREQLKQSGTKIEQERRFQFLRGLPQTHRSGGILYVHGTAQDPINNYLFPEDIYNQRKMQILMKKIDFGCFCGKTHVPGIFFERRETEYEFIPATDAEQGFSILGRKWICNVGSVGAPRDQDPRACYALFDEERIWFCRVPYDVETTIRKIKARGGF